MMDKLLNILKTNPKYKNFTMDGQTIPIEDYLEVCPDREAEIKEYIHEKRLSIGPMYILPDEFLISGESMIRNLLIGHQYAKKLGRVMKAGYIPDPFGHIAQLPQILRGFEIPSVLFWRGFGNEFEVNNLNVEFNWDAPGKADSILAINLILSYGSVANLNTSKKDGKYTSALNLIKRTVKKFEKFTATPFVLLNSGSDHHEARPQLPEIIEQWNKCYPDILMEQNDFEHYISKVLSIKPELNSFQGELRGGRYAHILTGVLSARMWIKQRNTEIEYLYEKYCEPLSAITWAMDKYGQFKYPYSYILTGLKWLIKNHPHDSICGCSIDQVHDEMKTRFDWAEQIGDAVFKNSMLYLFRLINIEGNENKIPFIVYNPLPWIRTDVAHFTIISLIKRTGFKAPEDFKIVDLKGNEIEYQFVKIKEEPRYTQINNVSFYCTFLANVPACGYSIYYLALKEKSKKAILNTEDFKITRSSLENEFYRVQVNLKGKITVTDKKSGTIYDDICTFEDVGDWGDEYDFSGPNENQTDLKFTSEDLNVLSITPYLDGPSQKVMKLSLNLNLPASLSEDRYNRDEYLVSNLINLYIILYKNIKRIDFKIEIQNNSKDHRIRVLFPSKIISNTIDCDGHFFVISRNIELPKAEKWAQNPLPTNHQKDFISLSDNSKTFSVLNKGLPEYEAIKNKDGSISLAITLLRCIEWLSQPNMVNRVENAGPDLNTPKAQCLGKHIFDISLVIEQNKSNWLDSKVHIKGKEFNNPLKLVFPSMVNSPIRTSDRVILLPFSLIIDFGISELNKMESFLPPNFSFLDIDNNNVFLSALKKSEKGDFLIIRCYNLSTRSQKANLRFYEKFNIKGAEIVNLLEQKPIHEIKARVNLLAQNTLELIIEAHVIATIKVEFIKTLQNIKKNS